MEAISFVSLLDLVFVKLYRLWWKPSWNFPASSYHSYSSIENAFHITRFPREGWRLLPMGDVMPPPSWRWSFPEASTLFLQVLNRHFRYWHNVIFFVHLEKAIDHLFKTLRLIFCDKRTFETIWWDFMALFMTVPAPIFVLQFELKSKDFC